MVVFFVALQLLTVPNVLLITPEMFHVRHVKEILCQLIMELVAANINAKLHPVFLAQSYS